VRYSGVDCDGRPVTAEVSGFHAGVVQHENDHLDGILYPMRMTDFRQMGFDDEVSWAEELTLRMDMIRTEWAASSGRV
jgi:peptide deformylase